MESERSCSCADDSLVDSISASPANRRSIGSVVLCYRRAAAVIVLFSRLNSERLTNSGDKAGQS